MRLGFRLSILARTYKSQKQETDEGPDDPWPTKPHTDLGMVSLAKRLVPSENARDYNLCPMNPSADDTLRAAFMLGAGPDIPRSSERFP